MADVDVNTNVYNLEIEDELRVWVGEQSTSVNIELMSGLAEIYGTEMVINEIYTFRSNSSVAIYTWHGCSVKVTGTNAAVNIVKGSRMILNVILHACFEQRRKNAEAKNERGPVILVVGPTDVGKSTLCRLLLNYTSRLGRQPVFIDLDVGQNSIAIPGTFGVLTIEKPADIVAGFDAQKVEVYQFGYKSPGHNIVLYFLLLKKLGQTLLSGLRQANRNVQSSGVIINSCGWVRGHGYDAITLAAMSFEIDTLCVIEEERLYSQLLRDMPSSVKVIYFPKVDGAVERSRSVRTQTRDAQVRQYFYGPTNQLNPHSFDIIFSEIHVFKVSTRPLYENVDSVNVALGDINIIPVPLGVHLVNQVLGVSSANTVSENIMLTNVIGFICVTHVNMNRGTVTVLSPQPGPIPNKIFLVGDIRLTEQLVN